MNTFAKYDNTTRPHLTVDSVRNPSALSNKGLRMGLAVLISLGVGLAVIISTYYVDNVKLLIGLIGGFVFVLITIRWPEFGILSLVALTSGLISLSWLPILHLGPISLNISDVMLFLLLGLVFLRATTQRGFVLYSSPLIIPLFLFVGAFLLSAVNAILIFEVNMNLVFRTVRGLALWLMYIPTLQLVRDEQALRRLLIGLLILTIILLIGVLFPNSFEPFLPMEERVAGTGARTYSDFTRVYFAGDMLLYAMIPVTVASLAMIKKGNQLWRIGLLSLLFFWLFRTLFRNYWLTLFSTCFLLLGFFSSHERFRLFKRVVPALIAVVLIVIVLLATQPTRLERIVYVVTDRVGSLLQDPIKNEGSLQWRMIETHYALRQISRHPLLGLGLANRYRPPMEAEAGTMYSGWAAKYVENGYLYIAVMMGLVGLLPFLWLCAAYLLRVIHHQHEVRDESLRAIYLGFGAAILGMVVCNIVVPTFVIGSRLIFFPVAMAINDVILRLEHEKRVCQ